MQCAQAFGIYTTDAESLPELIARIESAAGERALLERVRWFVLSVLRHLQHADWDVPEASDVSLDHQYDLAGQCLASSGFAKSLATVTKDDMCKFTLVEFRRTKNATRRILSTNTAAYRQVAAVLSEDHIVLRDSNESQSMDLSNEVESSSETVLPAGAVPGNEEVIPTESKTIATTADLRRARRRGFDDEQRPVFDTREYGESTPQVVPKAAMSPQEYAELELALARKDTGSTGTGSLDLSDRQGRISWMLGVGAGLALFALWWLVAS